jgi:uncharacterized membrane protein
MKKPRQSRGLSSAPKACVNSGSRSQPPALPGFATGNSPMNNHPPQQNSDGQLAGVMERNIQALIVRRQQEETRKPPQERIADAITAFTGSMPFVYIHLVVFGLWIIVNLPGVPFPKFDPTYVILAMFASVEAIFLSTFVLISQNRMAALADKRADLDLQISLLAEHEISRAITLLRDVAAQMGIASSQNPELGELARDVAPEQVLDKMEQCAQEVGCRPSNNRPH